jgi:hypothetical protein
MDFFFAALIGASFVVALASVINASTTVVANRAPDVNRGPACAREKRMGHR